MHFNPLDLLLIGILIYVAVSWFRRRSGGGRQDGPRTPHDGSAPHDDQRRQASDAYTRAQQAWDMLRSEDPDRPGASGPVPDVAYVPGQGAPSGEVPSATLGAEDLPPALPAPGPVPADFDTDDFMRGAKAFCSRIRSAWNARDLNDLRAFCTEPCMEDFRRRAQLEPRPPRHEIQRLDAGLAGVADLPDGRREATVYYVITEKDLSSNRVGKVRELWRFARTPGGSWLLDEVRPVSAEEGTRQ
ncbi:Tim44 domain-containing protein [Desulfocurvus vexinensis]|uniref:Tim44 domain-containing protein n=1 Tax=Desulfocurvus vexinensis TaxID=399548 RepID=UPI00049007B3|nr:Tim44-like domain-containing protein [Desulfocurvus vexinensis]